MGSCCMQKKSIDSPSCKNNRQIILFENQPGEEVKFSQHMMNESQISEQETLENEFFKLKQFIFEESKQQGCKYIKKIRFNRLQTYIQSEKVKKYIYEMDADNKRFQDDNIIQAIESVSEEINLREIMLSVLHQQLGPHLLGRLLIKFKNFTRLRTFLLFIKNEEISDAHINQINDIIYAQPFISKISLYLSIKENINNKILTNIGKCEYLQSLDLCLDLEDGFKQGLGKSLSKLKRLQRIQIAIVFESDIRFFGELFYGIGQIESLREVSLFFSQIEYRELKIVIYNLIKLPQLSKLSITLKSVRMITISKSDVLQYLIPDISKIINLNYFKMQLPCFENLIDIYNLESNLSDLSRLNYLNLKFLSNSLSNRQCAIKKNQLDFSNCKNLLALKLDLIDNYIDNRFIPHIIDVILKCPHIENLKLFFMQSEEKRNELEMILERIVECPNVKSLHFTYQCQDYLQIRNLKISSKIQQIQTLYKLKFRFLINNQSILPREKHKFHHLIVRKCHRLVKFKIS